MHQDAPKSTHRVRRGSRDTGCLIFPHPSTGRTVVGGVWTLCAFSPPSCGCFPMKNLAPARRCCTRILSFINGRSGISTSVQLSSWTQFSLFFREQRNFRENTAFSLTHFAGLEGIFPFWRFSTERIRVFPIFFCDTH